MASELDKTEAGLLLALAAIAAYAAYSSYQKVVQVAHDAEAGAQDTWSSIKNALGMGPSLNKPSDGEMPLTWDPTLADSVRGTNDPSVDPNFAGQLPDLVDPPEGSYSP